MSKWHFLFNLIEHTGESAPTPICLRQTLQEKKSLVQRDQDAIQAPGGLATRFSGVMWAKPSRCPTTRSWLMMFT